MKIQFGSRTPVLFAFAAFVSLLQGATGLAAEGDVRLAKVQEELKARFEKADANHDALLTREEARGTMPRVYSYFDGIDTAHTGTVSLNNIQTFLADKLQEREKQKKEK